MSCLPTNLFSQCVGIIKSCARRYEARRLHRDAITIIRSDEALRGAEFLKNVATELDTNIELARNASDAGETRLMVRERLRAIHKEARRHRDETGLSAVTLTIIHLRALELGAAGKPAHDIIQTFRLTASADEGPARHARHHQKD